MNIENIQEKNFKVLELEKTYFITSFYLKENFNFLISVKDKDNNIIENINFCDKVLYQILLETKEETYFKLLSLFTKESNCYEDFYLWFVPNFNDLSSKDNKEMLETIKEARLIKLQK